MPAANKTSSHLRGTGEYCHKYFPNSTGLLSHSVRYTPQTTNFDEIVDSFLLIQILPQKVLGTKLKTQLYRIFPFAYLHYPQCAYPAGSACNMHPTKITPLISNA